MHRLFWKLFLSFWAALILFAAAVILALALYIDRQRERPDGAPQEDHVSRHIAAARDAALGGLPALQDWAREVDRHELVPVLVLDRDGRDVLDREVSPHLLARLRRHGMPRHPPSAVGPRGMMGPPAIGPSAVVRLPDGGEYRLVPDFRSVSLGRFLGRPRVIAVPLLAAALAAGLVCLLLARYLAAPIERLRRASVSYAAGDFSQRVGPTLGRRRDEIVDLALALDHMAERLDTLMGSQQALLRDVSHELRTPLARLQAAVGLARQQATQRPARPRGGDAEAALERIEREAERLNELVGQILTLSRQEAQGAALRREPVELDELLRAVAEDAAIEAEARGCTLETSSLAPVTIDADAELLHSALENVVRNAIRHTAPGTAVSVELAMPASGTEAVIRIADHGPGVPARMLERIFEPFVRVGEARDRQSGGFGLGLAIARRAIRRHGGSIAAANRAEGGLEVTIRVGAGLPAISPVAAGAEAAIAGKPAPTGAPVADRSGGE
ncbi:MAG: HAMP domain-containing protein [Betaproteobacteria bacterium]|nr:HAMP domain-containing protein [Betaproteobacteria bacterium]